MTEIRDRRDRQLRLWLVPLLVALMAMSLMGAGACQTSPSPSASLAPSPRTPWYGVLQTTSRYLSEERRAGLTVATLELSWHDYEPARGAFSGEYVAMQKEQLQRLWTAGFAVVLDAGLQYPPAWVFDLDGNTRFVNQYGDRWRSDHHGDDIPNAVFDPSVRTAQQAYIDRIASDFGRDSFFAIRAGGLASSELRYPGSAENGRTNSYWCFDANAQADSPVPRAVPGALSEPQAQAFLDYYFGRLRDYQDWQIQVYRKRFSAWIQMLYPDWGLRPGDIDAAASHGLNGTTSAELNGLVQSGLDWESQVASISDRRTLVYTTWLEAPDRGETPQTESPVRYLASLSRQRQLPLAGENTGNTYEDMQRSIDRVRNLGLVGMMWFAEGQLSSRRPTFADYGSLIKQ